MFDRKELRRRILLNAVRVMSTELVEHQIMVLSHRIGCDATRERFREQQVRNEQEPWSHEKIIEISYEHRDALVHVLAERSRTRPAEIARQLAVA